MTYEELKSEVLALGFVDTLENENHLLLATNRALSLLANDFPESESLCLYREYHAPLRTFKCVGAEGIHLYCGERAAFCYRLTDGEVRFGGETLALGSCGIFRLQADKDGTLLPIGDAELYELAVYGEDVALSRCECTLPFVSYAVDEYTEDALRICRVPTDAFGAEITEARCEGRCVLIPRTYSGSFFVHYERRSRPATATEAALDIPRECISLFPLLVCGYLWLDDEPDRAQYYMALYREGRSMLRERKPSRTQRLNTDVLGWS